MGYRSRERKRRRKAAAGKAASAQRASQKRSRESGSSAARHWLTIVREKTCCARCGWVLCVGAEMVYRRCPREALCQRCAAREGVPYKPSLAWERRRRKAAA